MVLNYLRLGSDSTDYVICRVELDRLLHQSVKKYAKQFIRRRIRLDYKETGLTVLTDEKWLSFAIEIHARRRRDTHLRRGRGAVHRGHGHRYRGGGSAARVREGLYRLQRADG